MAAVLPGSRHAHPLSLHPHRSDDGQQVQVAFIEVEQMSQPPIRRLPRTLKRCQFPCRLGVLLSGGFQPGTSPSPALKAQVSPHRSATEHQPEPCGKKRGQESNRPARLQVPRVARRLASLRIDDVAGKRILGWTTASRLILQALHALLLVPMQPGPYHVHSTVVDPGDLGYRVTSSAQHHHLRPECYSPHSLPAHSLQLVALPLRQLHPYHPHYLHRLSAAGSMPYLCLCA